MNTKLSNKDKQDNTCGDCKRYGDLHSSCKKVRDLKANKEDKACDNFK